MNEILFNLKNNSMNLKFINQIINYYEKKSKYFQRNEI